MEDFFRPKQASIKKHKVKKTQWYQGKIYLSYRCPKKKSRHLIWCTLKLTVFTRSILTFSEFSSLKLKFGIKQSKIGWKVAEEWLREAEILSKFTGA